ncbi:MAG: hypothetical protein ACI936_003531 [Paraglaciecola sp.]
MLGFKEKRLTKFLYILLLAFFLSGCDLAKGLTTAKTDIDDASVIIKSELKISPNLTWEYKSDIVRVTVEFKASELVGIDANYHATVSKNAVRASFEVIPDEIIIVIILEDET